MTHDFIVNDDSIINEYGYRVMTDGISTKQYMRNPVVLYMHNRTENTPDAVIGRCTKLRKEGSNLIASIEFDEADELAQKVAGKIERGFIRMSSIHADIVNTSNEKNKVLKGQKYETVTQCKLVEISIVDIGGNDNAMKLKKGADALQLNLINQNKKTMSLHKILGFSLGKKEADESEIITEVESLKFAKEQADKRVVELEKKISDLQKELIAQKTEKSEILINEAVSLGLINEGLRAMQLEVLNKDFDTQSVVLKKLISEKKEEQRKNPKVKNDAFKEVVLKKNDKGIELSFDYLQKNNPAELGRIKTEEPERYVQLSKEYVGGKRYNN